VTGVTNINIELAPKRLELLHELVPTANVIALLVNPTSPDITKAVPTANELLLRLLRAVLGTDPPYVNFSI
jgi:putative ABC transport system substrate-binding protein